MQRIPKSTLKRLALYHRCFLDLKEAGVVKIQSRELSNQMGIEPATIRKDFSYLGELGRQGYGYKVDFVLSAFKKVIEIEDQQKCILIGAGNLGRALMNFFTSDRFLGETSHAPATLVAAFDANPLVAGLTVNDIPILHTDQMVSYIKENDVKYVVLAVPAAHAQTVVDGLKNLGIEGVLNLTSSIIASDSLVIHEVDLAIELETLVFTAIQEQVSRKETTIKDILDL